MSCSCENQRDRLNAMQATGWRYWLWAVRHSRLPKKSEVEPDRFGQRATRTSSQTVEAQIFLSLLRHRGLAQQEARCAIARTPSAARIISMPKARKRLVALETSFHSPVNIPAALLVTMIMPMSKGQPITTPNSPIRVMPTAYSD